MMFGKKDESVSKESVWYAPFIPALLATAGVACLELGGTDIPGVGDLWAFLQPLFFGLSFWRVEKHIHSAQEPGQPQAFTAAMMLAIAAGSCAWAAGSFVSPIVTGTHWGMESLDAVASSFNIVGHKIMTEGVAAEQIIWQSVQDWHVVAAIAWTGIVTTALTTFVENVAMKKLSASESTVIYSTEPLFGTAFAAIALHEHVGANTFVGAALIIAAMVWSTFGPLAISGVLAAASESFMNDQVEDELTENLGSNFVQIIQRLLQSNPEM
jgi:drug/metabolite transporter (DMT)-like permease